ncbi:MAG TPA: hypothetical protein VEL73_10020 [Mycobacteriales bacterium]|nr:hypothetical protein [Mycobacteriales bacterium]
MVVEVDPQQQPTTVGARRRRHAGHDAQRRAGITWCPIRGWRDFTGGWWASSPSPPAAGANAGGRRSCLRSPSSEPDRDSAWPTDRVFGKAGFEVALVARSHETIDQLLPLLRADTIGQVHWDLYTRREEVEHVHLPA